MNDAVVDASVILRWAFEDEADRQGALIVADALLSGELRAFAPTNFLLEVATSLLIAVRAGRVAREIADRVLAALTSVAIDEVEPHGLAVAAFNLALATGTRVPDAAYLVTASRMDVPLISADRAQLAAALAVGIDAVPLAEVSVHGG
jgi:predicted nucleic acid-binding protein